MSYEFEPSPSLTPAQHLDRARYLMAVVEQRIAMFAGEVVEPIHVSEVNLYIETSRAHIELAREIDRQNPQTTGGELVLAKLTLDDAKKTSEVVEDLPEITIDHPTRGWIRWSWENICWERMEQSGPQGGTP